jgi:uncharacterized protein YjiK
MRKTIFLLIFSTTLLSFCQQPNRNTDFIYNLNKPDETFVLPEILEEVSGITLLNDSIMLCIQDENGILYFYHLDNKTLLKQIKFGKDADYEDLALVGDEVFVLQSNGSLHRLKNFDNQKNISATIHKTALKRANDCEGLCLDSENNRLLIALKEKPEINANQNFAGLKAIYAFDLANDQLIAEPAIFISLDKLHTGKNALIERNEKTAKFHPSAIQIHPITGNIYVLASKGQALIVMNPKGEILAYEKLRRKIFSQPEGLTFAPDGTLYISNEGAGSSGNILKFKMRKP